MCSARIVVNVAGMCWVISVGGQSAGDKHGLGWALGERRWANGRVLYLQGSNTLNDSNVWIAPKSNRIYIAVTNGGSHDDFIASDDAIGALIEPEKRIDALER